MLNMLHYVFPMVTKLLNTHRLRHDIRNAARVKQNYCHVLSVSSLFIPYALVAIKIVSEYDQEIPQSQTADNPVASRGRAAQPSRDTMKTK